MATNTIDQHFGEGQSEVLAKAMFGSEMAAKLPAPKDRAASELAKAASEASSPMHMADRFAVTPVSSVDIAKSKETVIISSRDLSTGEKKRDREQKKNYDLASERIDFAQGFFKQGYEKLAPDQRKEFQEKALDALVKVWPDSMLALEGMTLAERQESMDKMLKDPLFARELKSSLEDVIKSSGDFPETPSVLEEKQEHAKLEMERAKKELELAQKDLADNETERTSLLASPDTSMVLQTLVDTAEGSLRTARRKTAIAREALGTSTKNNKTGVLPTTIDDEKAELRKASEAEGNAEEDLARAQKRLAERTSSDNEKLRLEAKKKELEKIEATKHHDFREKERAYYLAKAEAGDLNIEQKAFEASYLSKLNGLVETATRKYLEDKMEGFEEARDVIIKDAGNEALIRGLNDRWNSAEKGGKYNKGAIDSDYKALVTHGPDEVVINALVAGGMSRVDARTKYENDEKFAAEAKNDVVQRLLTRKVQTGSISENEAKRIVDSEWGGEQVIWNAYEEKAKYAGVLEKLKLEGANKETFLKKLKELPGGKLLALLLLLFGIGALITVDMLGGFGLATAAGAKAVGVAGRAAGFVGDKLPSGVAGTANGSEVVGQAAQSHGPGAADLLGKAATGILDKAGSGAVGIHDAVGQMSNFEKAATAAVGVVGYKGVKAATGGGGHGGH